MSENQEGKATGEDERIAMFTDLCKAEKILEREEKWTWKRINGRRYRCKRQERADDSLEVTGDDLAFYDCWKMDAHYARIKELIDSHPDGKFNYLAKYLPEDYTPPQQDGDVNNQQEESATMPRQSVKNTAPQEEKPTTIQPKEDKSLELEERKREEQREKWREAKKRQARKPLYPPELMNIIQSIEGYAASQSTPKVDIFKAINEIKNSDVLYSVMLRAALRISWLQHRPELDEAIKKCSLRENPS